MVPGGDRPRGRRRHRRGHQPLLPDAGGDGLPARGRCRAVGARPRRPARAARAAAGRPRRNALLDGDRAREPEAAPAVIFDRGRGSDRWPADREALLLLEAARGSRARDGVPQHDGAARALPPVGLPAGDEVPVRAPAARARDRRRGRAVRLPGVAPRAGDAGARVAGPPGAGAIVHAQPSGRVPRAARLPGWRRSARHPLAFERAPGHPAGAGERR